MDDKYFSASPKIVVEVDIKADVSDYDAEGQYIIEKTQKMIEFGVEKVIWVLTKNRKIFVAEKSNPTWIITHWQQTIPVAEGCALNLNDLVKKKRLTAHLAVL